MTGHQPPAPRSRSSRHDAGDVLGGRYELTERISGGGMGEVWRAADQVLGREVAVKILRREYADDPTFLARFRAEARHTANLSHPGIAAVHDFGEGTDDEQGGPFLVMELVPGEPLSALIEDEGALSPELTLDVVGQTALALQAAHDAGVIHRDVKPGNILVTPAGEVKITDFGIARATNSVPLTATGAIMGTAYYISPEQASGRPVTPASDIYSLGVVAYECLTGRRPFAGDTPVNVALAQVRDEPPALPEDLPPPVRDLVMRMLAKEPAQRPAGAGPLGREALELRATVAGLPAITQVLPVTAAGAGRRGADTNPGFHLPAPSRVPSWAPYALALGLLGVLLLVLVRPFGSDATDRVAAGTDLTPAATAPATVEVVASDFLGRPADQVRAEIEQLGLRVAAEPSAGGGTVGTVSALDPTGSLPAGSQVTLSVVAAATEAAEPAATEPAEPVEKDDKPGKGNGTSKQKSKGDDR